MDPALEEFQISVPDEVLSDLRDRLARTRYLDQFEGSGWTYGFDVDYLRQLCHYWADEFDWRAQEALINSFDQYTTDVDGQNIHVIHARSPGPDALPLLLVHGWPGSIFEFTKVLGPLSDPVAHGGRAEDAFHVVCPSLPGYGFSGPTGEPGWGVRRTSSALATLMERLGYERYGAQGGDWGSIITTDLAAVDQGRHLCGIHLTMPLGGPPPGVDADEGLSEKERAARSEWAESEASGSVIHAQINRTRPHTLASALNDSPAGLAAWIVEKFRSWSDCDGDVERSFTKDELLANVTAYWVTGTIGSSSRLYFESARESARLGAGRIDVPTGVSVFPKEVLRTPRPWVERLYDLRRWREMQAGGHFAALEQPELLVEEIRAFFRDYR